MTAQHFQVLPSETIFIVVRAVKEDQTAVWAEGEMESSCSLMACFDHS